MSEVMERQQNLATYRRLSDWIKQTYPPGKFLAISEGRIVAEADQFGQLRARLQEQGKNPTQVLIVQAGTYYPEESVIFSQGLAP
jgi:hypothetical protein